MFFSEKLPPLWWFRLLTSLAFFVGGIVVTIWAQGFRFDFSERELIPTGVVSVSSVPSGASLFHNDIPQGITPKVLLGIAEQKTHLCLEKQGFSSFCASVVIPPKTVIELLRIHLLPKAPSPVYIGKAQNIWWDPLGRGFVHVLPNMTEAQVWEHGKIHRVFAPAGESFAHAALTKNGDILLPSLKKLPLFVSSSPVFSIFSPQKYSFLYASKHQLFLHFLAQNISIPLFTFYSSLHTFFFFPHSDSFLAETEDAFFFFSHFSQYPLKISEKDVNTTIHFFPFGEWVFWQKDGKVYGFSFTKE